MTGVQAPAPAVNAEAQLIESVPKLLLIDGAWREGADGLSITVEDPSVGTALCRVADASPEDALAAVAAADRAQAPWAALAPRVRADLLRNACSLVESRADRLAMLITLEMGKPLAEARGEVEYALGFLRWFGEEAVRIGGRVSIAPDGGAQMIMLKRPVGPCVFITPWNFPLAMGARKIAPAIAAGCTMVVKPAPQTPLSMLAFADILQEAGLPDGVLNVITASDAPAVMEPVIADPRIRKLSFTGSTAVGRALLGQAAGNVLRVSMELGGNAPFVVFADADLDAAVEGAVVAKMRNGGEACTAANRLLVESTVAQPFAERLAERLGAMRLGRGTEPGVDVGPLIDQRQRARVETFVADAVSRGAAVLTGGAASDGPGYFYEPTVLADVTPDAALMHDEIFGPVAPVIPFSNEDEALRLANATEHGLVAYVYTRDLARALRVVPRLETGMVGLNRGVVSNPAAPFGGVKQSGLGREGGTEGIEEFLETQYVAVDLGDTVPSADIRSEEIKR